MTSVKKRSATLGTLLVALMLVASLILSASVLASPYPYGPADTEVANALDYLRDQQTADGDIGGFGASAWVTMAIAAAGEDPDDWAVGGNSIIDYLAIHAGSASSASPATSSTA